MTNSQIALRISGTKERQAGFAPLVMSGVLPHTEEDGLDRPLSGCNGLGFVVKHTPTYSFYMAVDGKVRAFDTTTPGVLTVAITIPADKMLAGNQSPYKLLTELYNLFVGEYMTESGDGRHVFQNVTANTEDFKAILGRYGLVSARRPKLSMNPSGPTGKLNVPAGKMDEFFKDSFYPEFQNFKDIEVGDGLATSSALQNLKIPRPVKYQIFVNGKREAEIDSKDTEKIIQAQKAADKQYCYEYCRFTLKELADNENRLTRDGAVITLDEANEKIDCQLTRREIPYTINLIFGADKEQERLIKKWLSNGSISLIMYDDGDASSYYGTNISDDLLTKTLKLSYDKLSQSIFKVSPEKIDGYKIKINETARINTEKREATLTINLQKEKRVAEQQSVNDTYANSNSSGIVGISKKIGPKGMNNDQTETNSSTLEDSNQKTSGLKDSKLPMVCTLIIGLLVGFAIGFYVHKYFFSTTLPQESTTEISEISKTEGTEAETSEAVIGTEPGQTEADPQQAEAQQAEAQQSTNADIAAAEQAVADKAAAEKAAAEKAAAEQAEAVKEAIHLFNKGDKQKFRNLCNQHANLKQYANDGYDILNVLQTAQGNAVLVGLLEDEGYIKNKDGRGQKSNITSLEQIKTIKRDIDRIKSEAQ